MTITLGEIVLAQPILSKLGKLSFRGRAAFVIAKLAKVISAEMEDFNAARDAILIKYADKDENNKPIIDNGQVHLSDENLAACNSEIQELLATEVEINASPLMAEWFDDIDITPAEVEALMIFIEE